MMSVLSDDGLVTDAVPSAPRSNPENNNESHVYIPKPKIGKKPRTSQSKTKQIPNTAFANVINISNSNMVHIGPNVVINSSSSKEPEMNHSEQYTVTREICALFKNMGRVSRDDLLFISKHIEKWKDVGRALEYSDGELNAFQHDYKEDGLNEVIFKMLYDWMCHKTKDAKIGVLAKVLWQSREQEAVKLWSAYLLER